MVDPVIAILSDIAIWLATLLPAVVAFRKGRGPWMIWSLAMALLTLPSALAFAGIGNPFMSKASLRWLVPLCIWLAAWFFTNIAINERIRDEQEAD
jgi:hypothetical protein